MIPERMDLSKRFSQMGDSKAWGGQGYDSITYGPVQASQPDGILQDVTGACRWHVDEKQEHDHAEKSCSRFSSRQATAATPCGWATVRHRFQQCAIYPPAWNLKPLY